MARRLAQLATVALLALVAAGCGDEESSPPSEPIPLLEQAASKRIDSADVRLRAAADIPGFPILGDKLSVTADGPIATGRDGTPEFDLDVVLRAGGQSFPARLYGVDGNAYVDFQGLSYEADRELLGMLPLDKDESGRGTSLRSLGIDPSDWLRNAKVEDGDDIGGDSTQVVTGTVNEDAVLEDLLQAAQSEGVQEQLDRAQGVDGLPELNERNLDRVAQHVDDVRVEVNVDDEGYPRRLYATLDFTMPEGIENAAFEGGTVSFELVLEQIGAQVSVQPPASPRPLSDLFNFAGVIFGVEKPSDIWTVPE